MIPSISVRNRHGHAPGCGAPSGPRQRRLEPAVSLLPLCLLLLGVTGPAAAQPAGAPASPPFSYAEAEARLVGVSDALAATSAATANRQRLADATRSLRLPDVAFEAREIKFQKSLDVPLGAVGPQLGALGIPNPVPIDQQDWRFRPTLSVTMPLYTGGTIPAAQRAAAASVRQAEAEHDHESQNQRLQLIQAYFGLRLADHVASVRRDVRDGLQRHLNDALKLEKAGMATRAQRLQATVARDQAEREYRKAESDRAAVSATLSQLLRIDREVAATTPLFVLSTPLGDAGTFRDAARNHQPQIARLRAMVEQAEQAVKVREAALRPQVFLFGQRDLRRKDALFTEPDWIFGVGVRISLFSASDRPSQIGAARSQLDQSLAGLREATNQTEIAVTRAAYALDSARLQFVLLESSLAEAAENLRLQERAFQEGFATSLDVIDARLRMGGASAERAQAAYQYDIALAHLLSATGQLDRFGHFIEQADRRVSP